ncbi:MAG: DUF983 domain-containing protein [Bacteroidetes bacterium]|nr:DUF983 domain-containing protein [Bacteroidota bacterium]
MCNEPAGSKLKGLLQQKCPKCRRGKVFTHRFYELAHYSDMLKNCSVCGHQFEIEPGYFYSAMYIGYMMTSAMCIIMGALIYFLLHDPDTWVYITGILVVLIGASPLTLRYSRMITMYFITNVEFDPKWK